MAETTSRVFSKTEEEKSEFEEVEENVTHKKKTQEKDFGYPLVGELKWRERFRKLIEDSKSGSSRERKAWKG